MRSESSGASYEGQWLNNMRHGKGTMRFNDDVYVGDWQQDKRHGNGTQIREGGIECEGQWQNDNLHGEAICHFPNGDIFQVSLRVIHDYF